MSACIVVDIGNTSTAIGRYEDGAVSAIGAVRGGMASRPENVDAALQAAGADTASRAAGRAGTRKTGRTASRRPCLKTGSLRRTGNCSGGYDADAPDDPVRGNG